MTYTIIQDLIIHFKITIIIYIYVKKYINQIITEKKCFWCYYVTINIFTS